MSAIPNQSVESYGETLNKVISLKPEHISSYSLIIEEDTHFYNIQDELKLVSEDDERKMYYKTKEILENSGYERYEISNYSLKGMESKHNSSYWTGVEYIGFGVGAASYLNGYRYDRIRDINKYIEVYDKLSNYLLTVKNIECNKQYLSMQNKMEEYMFLGLRMTRGVSISKFKELFDKDIHDVYGNVIDKYVPMNLLNEENDILRLTDKGIDVSNIVLADFLL